MILLFIIIYHDDVVFCFERALIRKIRVSLLLSALR